MKADGKTVKIICVNIDIKIHWMIQQTQICDHIDLLTGKE
jgi:hypothetical protein